MGLEVGGIKLINGFRGGGGDDNRIERVVGVGFISAHIDNTVHNSGIPGQIGFGKIRSIIIADIDARGTGGKTIIPIFKINE